MQAILPPSSQSVMLMVSTDDVEMLMYLAYGCVD